MNADAQRQTATKKAKSLSAKELREKVSNYGEGVYRPVADELLAKCAQSPIDEFSIFHDFMHFCRDALKHDENPTENAKRSLVRWYRTIKKSLAEGNGITEYPKVYAATEELLELIKTQLELREIPKNIGRH